MIFIVRFPYSEKYYNQPLDSCFVGLLKISSVGHQINLVFLAGCRVVFLMLFFRRTDLWIY